MSDPIISGKDPWSALRCHTAARIGLGRAGAGIPTAETLRFKLAHAQARDAVFTVLDVHRLISDLPITSPNHILQSAAKDRLEYLQRPDYGRRLNGSSRELLAKIPWSPCDLAVVVADGLSAIAIQNNAAPFWRAFVPLIADLKISPLFIVQQGRVAIGDEIGHLVGAKSVVVLIGERPGLSSPDSLGIYLTFAPRPGLTDERRNCISNVRHTGLSPQAGAEKLAWLLRQALLLQQSGVSLKDEMQIRPDQELLSG